MGYWFMKDIWDLEGGIECEQTKQYNYGAQQINQTHI